MVNLRVISFRKIKLNIKRFFIMSFGILIILSVINGIKIILKSNKEGLNNPNGLNDLKCLDYLNDIIYKKLLKDSFVFFDDDNYDYDISLGLNKNLDNDIDNHIDKNLDSNIDSNINSNSGKSNRALVNILKDNLGIISVIDDSIVEDDILDENLINSNFVYVKEGNEIKKENNVDNNEDNNDKENKTNQSIVNNFDNTYSLPIENSNDILDVDIKNISKKCETRVLEEKNKVDKYNVVVGNVKIRNESKYTIDENVLGFDLKFNNKKDIVIYHTHTCESYTASNKYNYVQTGNYRSTDLSYSVARVGDVLEVYLNRLGYNITHDKTYHDYPAYNGSYNRALKTIERVLNGKSSEIIIDLHRDAIGNNSDYGPTIEIGGEKVAQIMFVLGTDGGGLTHNNWKENLKFAIELQAKAEEMYPGFIKPIIVRNARYNQHVTKGAIIVEVGATGNTLEEAEGAMKYFSIVLDEYLKSK